jgi:Lon protease-like protein
MRSTLVLIAFLFLPGYLAGQSATDTERALPDSIPIFPLPDVTLFPNSTQPFHIFEARYRSMVADALEGDSIIGMVTLQPGFEDEYDGRPPVYGLGCAGVIVAAEQLDDGRYNIVLRGLTKFRVLSEDEGRPYRLAEVEAMSDGLDDVDPDLLSERRQQLEDALLSAIPSARMPSPDLPDEQVIDGLALAIPLEPAERLELLEAEGPIERAQRLIRWLRGGPPSSL